MISMHAVASRIVTLGLFMSLALVGTVADAAEKKPVTDEILEILMASGTTRDSKYEELLERVHAEEAERETPPEEVPATAEKNAAEPIAKDPKAWTVHWRNGTRVERNDGEFKLKFGGRAMLDFAQIWGDGSLRSSIGNRNFGSGVEFRRARLFAQGTLYDRFFFKVQYEFANTGDGNVDFKDVYIGLNDVGPLGTIRIGQMKEDFSLEEMTSSKYIVFMERAVSAVFTPDRNVGISGYNTFLDGRLRYALGGFHSTNEQGFGFKDTDGTTYHITGRLTGLPYWEDGGKKVVHLGFDYSHQFTGSGGTGIRYRQRPEAHLASRYANTRVGLTPAGDIDARGIDLFATEFAAVLNSVALQAEWQASLIDRGNAKDAFLWGAYGQVAWFVTGEHRNYTPEYGNFGRTQLKSTFDPAGGAWGAFELAARVSYLDLNDRGVRGGRLFDVTGGVNWYLWSNVRVMANYIHSILRDRGTATPGTGDGDIFEMRFQFDF